MSRRGQRGTTSRTPWIRLLLLAFALACAVALVADLARMRALTAGNAEERRAALRKADLQRLILGLAGERYVGPAGRFSMIPPDGWTVKEGGEEDPYDVTFTGPFGQTLSVLTADAEGSDMASLERLLLRKEEDLGLRTHIAPLRIGGQTAFRRRTSLMEEIALAVDFIVDGVAHHILFSAPREMFEEYEPVILNLLETYRPGTDATPD
jgi:hypothetical protein